MLAALVASIHKTEPPGDQVLEVLAACCLPQLLGLTPAVELSQIKHFWQISTLLVLSKLKK